MELSEVVNPHFAFPVVGVVLCAVLVFAFGFKSPVQPPSFVVFEEDRKPKKSKHKKKPHGTEHLESHTVEKPAAPHKQSTNSKAPAAANKPAVTVDKSPQNQKDNKNKTKKSPNQKPVNSNLGVVIKSSRDNEDGWETVSMSKKKKRNKKEQDVEPANLGDTPPSRALAIHNEPAKVTEPATVTEAATVTKPATVTEPATVTKSAKIIQPDLGKEPATVTKPANMIESDLGKEPATVTKPANMIESDLGKKPATVAEPAVADEPDKIAVPDAKPQAPRSKRERSSRTKAKNVSKVSVGDLSDKENTPEPDIQVAKQESEENTTKHLVKTEKKIVKNITTDEYQLTEIQSSQSPGDSTKDKKPKTKKMANKKELSPKKELPSMAVNVAQQKLIETSSSPESKSSKSHKSKKDKLKKEASPSPVLETDNVQEIASSSGHVTDVKSNVSSLPQSTLSNAQESKKEVLVVSGLSGTDVQPTPDHSMGDKAGGGVTFDELGDWQEAKPSKKRKSKVRRDN